jgi:hypothetical protein
VEVEGKLKPFWEGIHNSLRDRPQPDQPQLYLPPPLFDFLGDGCRECCMNSLVSTGEVQLLEIIDVMEELSS